MKEEAKSKISKPTAPLHPGVEIDWRTEGLEKSNPTYYIFNKIFEKFKLPDPVEATPVEAPPIQGGLPNNGQKKNEDMEIVILCSLVFGGSNP